MFVAPFLRIATGKTMATHAAAKDPVAKDHAADRAETIVREKIADPVSHVRAEAPMSTGAL